MGEKWVPILEYCTGSRLGVCRVAEKERTGTEAYFMIWNSNGVDVYLRQLTVLSVPRGIVNILIRIATLLRLHSTLRSVPTSASAVRLGAGPHCAQSLHSL